MRDEAVGWVRNLPSSGSDGCGIMMLNGMTESLYAANDERTQKTPKSL